MAVLVVTEGPAKEQKYSLEGQRLFEVLLGQGRIFEEDRSQASVFHNGAAKIAWKTVYCQLHLI